MKKFLYLCNYEFKRLSGPLFAVSILMILGQLVLQYLYRKDNYPLHWGSYIPYEEFLSSSGVFIVFYLAFGAVCVLFLLDIISNYHGSKSIYTLMTLPQDRSIIFISKLASGLLSFFTLFTSQLISVFIGYALYAPKIAATVQRTQNSYLPATVYRNANNGLFLAFIRSEFLRTFFPLSLQGAVSTLVITIAFVTGLFYCILCERSRRYPRIIAVLLQFGYSIYILNYRYNSTFGYTNYQNLYVHSALMFGLTVFFVWDSIRLIRTSAIS